MRQQAAAISWALRSAVTSLCAPASHVQRSSTLPPQRKSSPPATATWGGLPGPPGQIIAASSPAQGGNCPASLRSGASGSSATSSKLICGPAPAAGRGFEGDFSAGAISEPWAARRGAAASAPVFEPAFDTDPPFAGSDSAGAAAEPAGALRCKRASVAISRRRACSSNSSAMLAHWASSRGLTVMSSRVSSVHTSSEREVSFRHKNMFSRWSRSLS